LLLICFYTFSVGCWTIQRQLLVLNTSLHWEHLRNKKGGDVGDWGSGSRPWHEHSYVKTSWLIGPDLAKGRQGSASLPCKKNRT
jgi:hypothetical protein